MGCDDKIKIKNDLKKFIESTIIPEYSKFDDSHNIHHVTSVINDSLYLHQYYKDVLDINIVYTIAAYHDIGLLKNDRDKHHIYSHEYVLNDNNLLKWFNDEEINIIANGCKNHRASMSKANNNLNLYEKLINDADRSKNIDDFFLRSIKYRMDLINEPDLLFEVCYKHLVEKYSENGYAKFFLPETKKLKSLKDARLILNNKEKSRLIFNEILKKVLVSQTENTNPFNLNPEELETLNKFNESFSHLEIIQENVGTITTNKRKEIEKIIFETYDILDPSGFNTKKLKEFFNKMDNIKFTSYFKKFLSDSKENFFIETIPFKNDITLENIKKAAKYIDIPLEEYVYFKDDVDAEGNAIRTREKVLVGYINCKRLQQFLFKKNSFSLNIKSRSGKTNQVSGDDKISRITDGDNFALAVYEADNAAREFLGLRADNDAEKNQAYKMIMENGYFKLEDLESTNEDKQTLNTVDVYFLGAGIKTDLVTDSLFLTRTLSAKKQKKNTSDSLRKDKD